MHRLAVAQWCLVPLACLLWAMPMQAAPEVSAHAARILDQAAGLLERGQFNRAEPLLSGLLGSSAVAERALAMRLLAWSAVQQGSKLRAIASYRDLLAIEPLEASLREEAVRNLAHLLFEARRYAEVIELLNTLPATQTDSRLLLTLAQAQYQAGQHRDSATTLQRAVGLLKRSGKQPDEAMLGQLRALQFAARDWDGLRDTLQELVARFPKRAYWLHLADTWARLGRPDRQVATLDLARLHGDLETSDLDTLVRAMIAAGTPARAARLLEQEIARGTLQEDAVHLNLLYQARWLARDHDQALEALRAAARAAPSPARWLQLARHLNEREDWAAAIETLRSASTGAKGPQIGEIAMLQGIALTHTGQLDAARANFEIAQTYPAYAASAGAWFSYLDTAGSTQQTAQ